MNSAKKAPFLIRINAFDVSSTPLGVFISIYPRDTQRIKNDSPPTIAVTNDAIPSLECPSRGRAGGLVDTDVW